MIPSDKGDRLSSKAEAAFQQAAAKVIQRAKQTGTPVIVWKEGQIEEIPSDRMETLTLPTESKTAPGSLPTAD